MFKKMFMLAAVMAGVSVFAATDFKKVDYSTFTAESVAQIKADLGNVKAGDSAAGACAIAVYRFENGNKILSLAEMEGIANKHTKQVLSSVIYYARKAKMFNYYLPEFLKNEKYSNTIYFCNLVVTGAVKVDNPQDYCFIVLSKSRVNVSLSNRAAVKLIEFSGKMPEAKAVEALKKAYQIVLPRLVEYPELKTAATKLGLALKSYGVDVK